MLRSQHDSSAPFTFLYNDSSRLQSFSHQMIPLPPYTLFISLGLIFSWERSTWIYVIVKAAQAITATLWKPMDIISRSNNRNNRNPLLQENCSCWFLFNIFIKLWNRLWISAIIKLRPNQYVRLAKIFKNIFGEVQVEMQLCVRYRWIFALLMYIDRRNSIFQSQSFVTDCSERDERFQTIHFYESEKKSPFLLSNTFLLPNFISPLLSLYFFT